MEYKYLKLEVWADALLVTIDGNGELNTLHLSLIDELQQLVYKIKTERKYRAVVFKGAGNKAFIVGADLKELIHISAQDAFDISRKGQALFKEIEQSEIPYIAVLNGFAIGGGLELAMACHLRIAEQHAQMGLPESKLGLIPGFGGTQRLSQLVGKGRALELLLSSRFIDAETALNYGLVNQLAKSGEGLMKAQEWIQLLSKNSPYAVGCAIKSVEAYYAADKDGYLEESQLFRACIEQPDSHEGMQAFIEKRKANFS